jgi:hypothetical protein
MSSKTQPFRYLEGNKKKGFFIMVLDERRRQKKLARKAAKRKKALAGKRKEVFGKGDLVAFAAGMPLHECLIPKVLYDQGIGNVVISRKMPNGDIAAGFFLVDIYCLGVKNCFFAVIPPGAYAQRIDRLVKEEGAEHADPACTVKLIQEAVSYAEGLGFHPHRDYLTTRGIFGSIDPTTCSKEFEFGKDGKPFYISGPNETMADSERIVDILKKKLGPGRFDYMVQMDLKDQ